MPRASLFLSLLGFRHDYFIFPVAFKTHPRIPHQAKLQVQHSIDGGATYEFKYDATNQWQLESIASENIDLVSGAPDLTKLKTLTATEGGVRALGFTNALYVDVDGNGNFDAP